MTRPRGRRRERRDAVLAPFISGTLAASPGMYTAAGPVALVLLPAAVSGLVAFLIVRR
ncbi:hypothetical protein [Phytomonospora endophytica]|uniref:Uncharacterized protein n=1 Tax=Phytomonospora endophytica TaxID=714109 RepID=A0A841FSJ3_9ACTN|nr:hypothetical protein [Phytomonospora endophytica]MBB6035499.1 hypothetical protein [Phytomonospora endophytica]GIG63748.1 hypothetical protein Pen01_00430 [Phytomonospora endophytica]